jgi:hypothetical protein
MKSPRREQRCLSAMRPSTASLVTRTLASSYWAATDVRVGTIYVDVLSDSSGYRIQCRANLSRTARCCVQPLGRRSAKCPLARKYGIVYAGYWIRTSENSTSRQLVNRRGEDLPLAMQFLHEPARGRRRACRRARCRSRGDLHDVLWATFVVQALPVDPQHCHPRARFPVPGARRCHSRGCRLVLCGTGNPRSRS